MDSRIYLLFLISVKNKLTVTRGEVGGDNRGEGGRVYKNSYEGHMDKNMGGGGNREGGGDGWGDGEEWGKKAENCI